MVAGASVVGTSLVGPIHSESGEPASAASARCSRRCWLSIEVLFEDKDGRETSLAQAGAEQKIRCRYDFGRRWEQLLQQWWWWLFLVVLLLLFSFIFHLLLLAALSDFLVAKGDEIRGIMFNACADSLRKLFDDLWIVLVLGTKVLNAHGSVLGQLEGMLIVIGCVATTLARLCRVGKMHDGFIGDSSIAVFIMMILCYGMYCLRVE